MYRGLIALLAGCSLFAGAVEAKDCCPKPVKMKKVKVHCCQTQVVQTSCCQKAAPCQVASPCQAASPCHAAATSPGTPMKAVEELPAPKKDTAPPPPPGETK